MDPQIAPAPTEATQAHHETVDMSMKDVQENTDMAALSYVWVLSVFVYIYRRPSPFVRFHARQGMALFVLSTVFWFVPVIGRLLVLAVLALALLGFISAAQGQWRQLPAIYALSRGDLSFMLRVWKVCTSFVAYPFRRNQKHAGESALQGAQSNATNSSITPTL